MKFSLFLVQLIASFIGLVSCDPWDGKDCRKYRDHCLTDGEAAIIANEFASLNNVANVTLADNLLADNFQEISDSINFFLAEPPGYITSPSKADFIASDIAQTMSPGVAITIEAVYHGCHDITFRWYLQFKPYISRGIDVLIITPDNYQIETDYSEFNNGAILVDDGLFPCKS